MAFMPPRKPLKPPPGPCMNRPPWKWPPRRPAPPPMSPPSRGRTRGRMVFAACARSASAVGLPVETPEMSRKMPLVAGPAGAGAGAGEAPGFLVGRAAEPGGTRVGRPTDGCPPLRTVILPPPASAVWSAPGRAGGSGVSAAGVPAAVTGLPCASTAGLPGSAPCGDCGPVWPGATPGRFGMPPSSGGAPWGD